MTYITNRVVSNITSIDRLYYKCKEIDSPIWGYIPFDVRIQPDTQQADKIF